MLLSGLKLEMIDEISGQLCINTVDDIHGQVFICTIWKGVH